MKLEYKILWLDNDLQSYIDTGSVKDVEDFLIEKGFQPIVEKVFDEANIDEFIDKHDYDLILSDYNLENTTGDEIIQYIRETKHLDTDILFYTAQGNYKNNPEVRERLAFIERLTFQVGRDTLIAKIEKVISLTLKKLLELNSTRGIVTAATSELDVDMEEVVMMLIKKNNLNEDALKAIITNKVVTPLGKKLESFWDKFENFENYFNRIDAVKKWEIFRDLLKPHKAHKQVEAFLKTNARYQKDIIDIRNKFAHAKAEKVDGKMILKGQLGAEDYEYDETACVKVRIDIITHKNELEKLRIFLSA